MNNSPPSLPLTYACIFAAGMGVAAMAQGRRKVIIEAKKISLDRFVPDCSEPIRFVPDPVVIEAGRLALKITLNYHFSSWANSIHIPRNSSGVTRSARTVLLTFWPDVSGLGQYLFNTTEKGVQSGSYRLTEIGLKFEDYPSVLSIDIDEGFEQTTTDLE